MNEKDLFEAIGEIDDEILSEEVKSRKKTFGWVKWASLAAACIAITVTAVSFIPKDDIPVAGDTAFTTTTAPDLLNTSLLTETTVSSETYASSYITTTAPAGTASETFVTTVSETSVPVTTTTEFSQIHLPNQTVITEETTITETLTTTSKASQTTTDDSTTTSQATVPAVSESYVTTNNALLPPDWLVDGEEITAEPSSNLLAQAVYPDMPQYPNEDLDYETFDMQYKAWDEFREEYHFKRSTEYKSSFKDFTQSAMSTFLTGNSSQNTLFSPINTYFALSLTAEISDGNSRSQLLNALNVSDINTLREYSNILWESNYCNDGAITSIFANSLWLHDTLNYNADTLGVISDNYYASVFSGDMGSDGYSAALQEWLSEQTGGFLSNQSKNIRLTPDTVLALASTVFFQGKWANKFNKDLTEESIFRTFEGEEINCDFMYRSSEDIYYWGEGYSAINLKFSAYYNAKMWLILPDEGVSTDELINNGTVTELTSKEYSEITDKKRLIINMAVPKFDTAISFDLRSGLEKMGVTDIFDASASDFSSIFGEVSSGITVSQANHSVRISIDEDGCTATAFTAMGADGDLGPPDDEVDFVLDRPFIFVITGVSNDPLFAGVINNPTE